MQHHHCSPTVSNAMFIDRNMRSDGQAIADDDGQGSSNADAVVERLQEIGYIATTLRLNPLDHGIPHRRRRLWFLAFSVSYSHVDARMYEKTKPMLDQAVNMVDQLRLAPPPLSDFLFADNSPELALWRSRRVAKQESLNDNIGADSADSAGWRDLHGEMFRRAGLRYPPVLALSYDGDRAQRLLALPDRCREIVYYLDEVHGRPAVEEVVDLGQSINRTTRGEGFTPCLLPNSIMWARLAFRELEPPESLALQGLPWFGYDRLSGYSNRELFNLAGNAFCGNNALALVMAAFSVQRQDFE